MERATLALCGSLISEENSPDRGEEFGGRAVEVLFGDAWGSHVQLATR